MDEICRLCCSSNFVNNHIFDDESAIYLKMSLYLPIKVFKNDRLPQKICDKCSCKVNDFYQFCNEAIEVQNRLRSTLKTSNLETDDIVDLTLVKDDKDYKIDVSLPPHGLHHQMTHTQHQITQTDPIELSRNYGPVVSVKKEPKCEISPTSDNEERDAVDSMTNNSLDYNDVQSDNSDISLNALKKMKKKCKKEKKSDSDLTNGRTKGNKKERKRKRKLKGLEALVNSLPKGTILDRGTVPVDSLGVTHEIGQLQIELGIVKDEVLDHEDDNQLLDMDNLGLLRIKKMSKSNVEMETETGEYKCCICFGFASSQRSEMLQHYKSHVDDADRTREKHLEVPPVEDGGFIKCNHCPKEFRADGGGGGWRRHARRHERRPFRCALCEKTFRNPANILKHGLTHSFADGVQPLSKRFVCDLCPEEFVYMRYLLEHRRAQHPEAERSLALRCVRCGRHFAHLNSLRRHLRAHSGERNHLCNICGKALSSREHLKFHIRIHTGYKPNVCKTCGKGFVKKCNLTLHERVHSGEKPHVCSHCGKAFSQRSTLVIHERYHSGARPYACSLCGRGFVAKGLLSMHLKTTCI